MVYPYWYLVRLCRNGLRHFTLMGVTSWITIGHIISIGLLSPWNINLDLLPIAKFLLLKRN